MPLFLEPVLDIKPVMDTSYSRDGNPSSQKLLLRLIGPFPLKEVLEYSQVLLGSRPSVISFVLVSKRVTWLFVLLTFLGTVKMPEWVCFSQHLEGVVIRMEVTETGAQDSCLCNVHVGKQGVMNKRLSPASFLFYFAVLDAIPHSGWDLQCR